jgi:uncharacterized protein (TIGR02391 family)
MARKPPPQKQSANLSTAEMQEAIPRIKRRIKDLEEFDPSSITDRGDPKIQSLETKLHTLITDIFGHETVEWHRYIHPVTHLDTAGYNVVYGTPIHEVQEGLKAGKATSLQTLHDIVEYFEEEIGDVAGTPASRAMKAYEGLDLHPEIARAASQLYKDGHYANAIVNAVIALNDFVRLRSSDARDGTQLMEFVFNPSSPILKFNALQTQSDKDEQRGFMMMFSGAVAGLRNPRAHTIIKDDPERALEFIAFISLLAKLADEAKK